MSLRIAFAAALCAAGARAASPDSDPVHVSVAPAVSGQVQISTLARDAAAFDGPLPSLTWPGGGETSAILGAAWKGDQLVPSIGLRRRLLAQESAGLDVAVSAAFRSVGREDTGSEVAFAVQQSD